MSRGLNAEAGARVCRRLWVLKSGTATDDCQFPERADSPFVSFVFPTFQERASSTAPAESRSWRARALRRRISGRLSRAEPSPSCRAFKAQQEISTALPSAMHRCLLHPEEQSLCVTFVLRNLTETSLAQARDSDRQQPSPGHQQAASVIQIGDVSLNMYIEEGELFVNGIRIENAAREASSFAVTPSSLSDSPARLPLPCFSRLVP